MAIEQVTLFKHQKQLVMLPEAYPKIQNFFLIGGYGCGKTSGDVFLLLRLIKKYYDNDIIIGVGGVTITMLKKTLINEFIRYMIMTGSPYTFDRQENVIRVGRVTIILIATETPDLLYGYNFNVFIGDEIDELPMDKSIGLFKAAQERVRVTLPDGRSPMSFFTTTAQGFAGTYTIIESLKDKNIPYVKIRGLTRDNTSLDKSSVDKLYKIYDENERLAFLEGHFVNLNTGRVYGSYDSATCRIDDFSILPDEYVYIGQDFNAGFNHAVAMVKREKSIIVIKDFEIKQIGDAPRILRNAYPNNPILWFPDASGKEIMAGYASEIKNKDIELRWGPINPSIVERIYFVNKLFQLGLMKIFKSVASLDLALKTRQFDDNGKPTKGRGPLAVDHSCDAFEYAVWRLVASEPDLIDIWRTSLTGRRQEQEQIRNVN